MNKAKLLSAASLLCASSMLLPSVSMAQAGAQQPSAEQRAKIQEIAKEYQQVATELGEIRENTYAANPELAKQRDTFQKMVENAVADSGFDSDSNVEEMQDIAEELKQEDIDEARKQELVQDFQQKRQALANARQQALAKPEVRAAGENLRENTIAAMKTQSDRTQGLLNRLESLGEEVKDVTGQS